MTKTLVATAAGVIFLCANRKIRAYVEVIKVEVFILHNMGKLDTNLSLLPVTINNGDFYEKIF